MKILLIHPAYKEYKLTEPLGLSYIASYLRNKGYNTDIYDPRINKFNLNDFLESIKEVIKNYDLVGITCCDYYHEDIKNTINGLRKLGFIGHITLGGYGPTTNPNGLLKCNSNSIIIGEGEQTFYELASKIEKKQDWTTIDGIAYIDSNGLMTRNKKRKLIENLDLLPFPSREVFIQFRQQYGKNFISPQIQGSRGCYMNCSFCSTPDFLDSQGGNRYRLRSIKSIVDEIENLYNEYNVKDFEFVDDNVFPPDHKQAIVRATEFYNELRNRRIEITFFMQFRLEYISLPVLKTLKKAGMTRLFIGLESINPDDLRLYGRTYSDKELENGLKTILKAGYSTNFNSKYRLRYGYINFSPLSTLDKLECTGKFFKKYKLTYKKLSKKLVLFDNKRKIYHDILENFPEYNENNEFKNPDVGLFYSYLSPYFKNYIKERDRYRVLEKTLIKTNKNKIYLAYISFIRKYLDNTAYKVYMRGIQLARLSDNENQLQLYFKKKSNQLELFKRKNKKNVDYIFKRLNINNTANDLFF